MARRRGYYTEGSTARQIEYDYAEPARRERRVTRERERSAEVPRIHSGAARQAEKSLAFDARYMAIVITMVLFMAAACTVMLVLQTKVSEQESNIESLQIQIQDVQADNSAYENSLENMYSLDDIYNIATGELGMVYSQNGQIIYYDNADGDYVKQYGDVPSGR